MELGIKDWAAVFWRDKRAFLGFCILVFFGLMATLGPVLFKLDLTVNYAERFQLPSWQHILGTDWAGRGIFTQIVYGSREVLTVALVAAVFTVIIGASVGMLSGWVGGRFDAGVMLIVNVILTLPQFPIYIILGAIITIGNPITFGLILSLFGWAGLARAVRSQIMSLKERDFIVICLVMGRGRFAIIFKELLPNITSYIAINFIFAMRGAVGASVGVMLLGLVPYSATNWGQMLNIAIQQTGAIGNTAGYIYVFAPIFCIGLLTMGSVFFANGLDAALNPRLR